MSDVMPPKVGQIVLYYADSNSEPVPAIVVRGYLKRDSEEKSLFAALTVFGIYGRTSTSLVPHESIKNGYDFWKERE